MYTPEFKNNIITVNKNIYVTSIKASYPHEFVYGFILIFIKPACTRCQKMVLVKREKNGDIDKEKKLIEDRACTRSNKNSLATVC